MEAQGEGCPCLITTGGRPFPTNHNGKVRTEKGKQGTAKEAASNKEEGSQNDNDPEELICF